MAGKHTPEPWTAEPSGGRGAWLKGANEEWTALACGDTDETADANARRIVACANACAGIPTEDLERGAHLFAAAPELAEALEATQPLLQVAMLEAQKRGDGEFLSRLQTTFAANSAALAKAHGEG